jgi:hypothetical protein
LTIEKEISKSESQLIELARKLKRICLHREIDSLFHDPQNMDVNLNKLEIIINHIMNTFKNSIIRNASNEKCCKMVSDFLEINYSSKIGKVWLKGFSLCHEFPFDFTLSPHSMNILFPNFQVKNIKFTIQKNVFKFDVFVIDQNKAISVVKTLNQIELYANTLFKNLEFPSESEHINFKNEIKYLLNVCLNECINHKLTASFLEIEEVTSHSIYMKTPQLSLDIESYFDYIEDDIQYRLTLEFGVMETNVIEVVRSKSHFMLLSRNLVMRFGEHLRLKSTMFGNVEYIKKWLEDLFENQLLWRSTELKIFLNYYGNLL